MTDAARDANATPLLPARATADGTHRRILEAALIRFSERGFHGVSVREIAEASGVRASSVYAHLESKEQLLFQLMLVGHEEHHECLRLALLEAGSDPVEQITELTRAHVRMHATYPLMARVANREMAALSPDSRQRILDVRRSSEQLFTDVIGRGQRLGVFHVEDQWLGFAAIGSMGLRVAEWWDDALGFDVEQVADTYATFAVRLLTG
jgi:AcrR family transcriptional regulator